MDWEALSFAAILLERVLLVFYCFLSYTLGPIYRYYIISLVIFFSIRTKILNLLWGIHYFLDIVAMIVAKHASS